MTKEQVSASRNSTARPGDEIAPSSYRKKPVVIQAIRWSGTNLKEVIDFTGRHESADSWAWEHFEEVVRTKGLKIFSLEGSNFIVTKGDYIIRGVKGESYACKPDIFWMTYERESTAAGSERGTLPEELFDGHAVYAQVNRENPKSRIEPNHVSTVLDVLVRMIRKRTRPAERNEP